jgi:hypothetical protein
VEPGKLKTRIFVMKPLAPIMTMEMTVIDESGYFVTAGGFHQPMGPER